MVDVDQVGRDPVGQRQQHVRRGRRQQRLDQPRAELVRRQVAHVGQDLVDQEVDDAGVPLASSGGGSDQLLQEVGAVRVPANGDNDDGDVVVLDLQS